MDQNPLLDMLSELDSKMRLLQRERNEAVARARTLEREVSEMVYLVAQVRSRVEKMLKSGTEEEAPPAVPPGQAAQPTPATPAAPAVQPAGAKQQAPAMPAVEPKDAGRLDEFSPDPDRLWQRLFPPVSGPGDEPDMGASSI